jgi:hypothetical protein
MGKDASTEGGREIGKDWGRLSSLSLGRSPLFIRNRATARSSPATTDGARQVLCSGRGRGTMLRWSRRTLVGCESALPQGW